ncbi:xanthine dehydrogenase family protein molybdopterin-binding subunit [Rhizobium sp. YIM 134829]|uniref:xanthine dehydrogenase family protein molybdopterin-binding subunit n=1 Tax=Rhizobium sp. YIM 134829 TaxID=3390453 RepID=UPI00397CF861
MPSTPFKERPRIDALDKVRGKPIYAADIPAAGVLHAMTVPARIALGTMTALSTDTAMAVPGVVRVLTPNDFPPPPEQSEGFPPPPTLTWEIAYRGQPVALVLAETIEAAIEGAEAIRPEYSARDFVPFMDSDGAVREPVEDIIAGDAMSVLQTATTIIDQTYRSPPQHHNPIELLSTTAVWHDGQLTIFEGCQNTTGTRNAIAGALGIDPAVVVVKSPSIGGGFGQKGIALRQSAIVARAAIITGRPVKLVTPRSQIFHTATFRPQSVHRIRLGADVDGRMIAVHYNAEHEQSRNGFFPPNEYHEVPCRLYDIPNYLGTAANLRIDRQDPGYMRAPHPQASCFAFESAVDEMAYALGRDPLDFRLAHDTKRDPVSGNPLSSRFLNRCLEEGARRFGWSNRSPAPQSMVAADGTQIGWGVACGAYPSSMTPNIVTFRVNANGSARIALSGHEMGQGMRTAIVQALLKHIDIDPDRLEIAIGDTSAAPQHMTAGSWGTASVVPASEVAGRRMQQRLTELLAGRAIEGNAHRQLAAVRRPFLEVEISQLAPGQDASALDDLRQAGFTPAGPAYPSFTTMSYVAHFAEVTVEPRTRRIRVPRFVTVADCGRVVSPKTARSQIQGCVVWGIGGALLEETHVDGRFGGYLNCDLADYLVAVHADVGNIEVAMIDEPDLITNEAGVKGLGNGAMVGASSAIANAVYHATGVRVRHLPIRVEDLL